MDHAVGYMMRLLASLTEPAIAHSLVRVVVSQHEFLFMWAGGNWESRFYVSEN